MSKGTFLPYILTGAGNLETKWNRGGPTTKARVLFLFSRTKCKSQLPCAGSSAGLQRADRARHKAGLALLPVAHV